jgi:hypothetical protein
MGRSPGLPQLSWEIPPTHGLLFCSISTAGTDFIRENEIGTVPALKVPWLNSGPGQKKRDQTMIATFSASRETATAFAAAFITAMLFVSTATSLIA